MPMNGDDRMTTMPSFVDALALTHLDRDKMAAILQTMFSNAFSWMEIYEFR